MFICIFGHWKSKNNKFSQTLAWSLAGGNSIVQAGEKLVLLEGKHCKQLCACVYLHGLLYTSVAGNAMLHQSFCESELNVQMLMGKFPYFLEHSHI